MQRITCMLFSLATLQFVTFCCVHSPLLISFVNLSGICVLMYDQVHIILFQLRKYQVDSYISLKRDFPNFGHGLTRDLTWDVILLEHDRLPRPISINFLFILKSMVLSDSIWHWTGMFPLLLGWAQQRIWKGYLIFLTVCSTRK